MLPHLFQTAKPATALYCHQEFLEQLDQLRTAPIGKRASLLLQRLAVDPTRVFFKGTRGDNQGWRRSRLGGNQGSHFYLWWAPRLAAPLAGDHGFSHAEQGSVFLRSIRHHDDHSPLTPHSFESNYLPVTVPELRDEAFGPAPWTSGQTKFAGARSIVRLLKGFPGSGKTTALLHAADLATVRRALYVTYSPDLAALARQYFDCYCDSNKKFHVLTYPALLRLLTGEDTPVEPQAELLRRFRGDLLPHSRSLGMWSEHYLELYEEMHAHLIGAALPLEVGRFAASDKPRCPDRNYKQRRARFLGIDAASMALEAAARLERASGTLASRYFPQLDLAWTAAMRLQKRAVPDGFLDFDCIAIDECQDLTPLESFVLVELGRANALTHKHNTFLAAGDEAQTVRPTDFEWGWLSDLLHFRITSPQEFRLQSNLRSPRAIAKLVNHVWDLYAEVEKRDRPSGNAYAEVDDESTDQLFYCTAAPGEELNRLLTTLGSREGLALIAVNEISNAIPQSLRSSILTPEEAKGLDFHTACLIDAGWHLDRIMKGTTVQANFESIRKRLAIDRLRVALSRPAERLIWLDIQPPQSVLHSTLSFFNWERQVKKVSPIVAGALITTLEEEQLDLEERIQRCMADARQYLEIRPEIAWSRASQAVTLSGQPGDPGALPDGELREQAGLTLVEICLRLVFKKVKLPQELGNLDLLGEAWRAAYLSGREKLSWVISSLQALAQSHPDNRQANTVYLAQKLIGGRAEVPSWFWIAAEAHIQIWLADLERHAMLPENAAASLDLMPAFYEVLGLPDARERSAKLRQRMLSELFKTKKYRQALSILQDFPERDHAREASCHSALGEHQQAAELYIGLGMQDQALDSYRQIPDFDRAWDIMRQAGTHPAAPAYDWIARFQQFVKERPANFNKVLNPAEKRRFQELASELTGIPVTPAGPGKGAARAIVVEFLKKKPGAFYCSGCLVEQTKAASATSMYSITRALETERGFRRGRYRCAGCKQSKTCTGVV